jgi:hypothetical protein
MSTITIENNATKSTTNSVKPLTKIAFSANNFGKQRLAAAPHNFLTFIFLYCDATA